MLLGLVAAVVLAHGSVLKAIAMIVMGLLIGLVGTDGNTGGQRFTFGIRELTDGIDVATLAIGLFGIGEIISNLARPAAAALDGDAEDHPAVADRRRLPARPGAAVLRGTALGSILGVLPGGGATLSSFAAYALEKKVSNEPERFGRGAVEGVAAPESANNAGAQTSFIPMLTLGIPGNAVMALMIGALTIHGIQPGPQIMTERPQPVLGHDRVDVDRQPDAGRHQPAADRHLGAAPEGAVPFPLSRDPAVLRHRRLHREQQLHRRSCMAAFFGVVGFVLMRLECEPAPMILGFVLGPLMEENLRRAMKISGGDPMIFLSRPISLGLLIARRCCCCWSCCRSSAASARRCFRRRVESRARGSRRSGDAVSALRRLRRAWQTGTDAPITVSTAVRRARCTAPDRT